MNTSLNNDEIFIVKRMIDGDKKALKYFFEKYYTPLCNFVNIYLNDEPGSEEVVQDIFVYFWENKSKIKINSSVKAYLFGAAKYKSLNVIRDTKKHSKLKNELIDVEDPDAEIKTDFFSSADDFKGILDEAIQSLPEKCRDIFKLSKQENLSNKEIAEKFNISVKTVENQMTIAIKKLRKLLEPHREKIFILFLINIIG